MRRTLAALVSATTISLVALVITAAPTTGATGCTITGTGGGDNLHGTGGADVICAKGGADTVDARAGNDTGYLCYGE